MAHDLNMMRPDLVPCEGDRYMFEGLHRQFDGVWVACWNKFSDSCSDEALPLVATDDRGRVWIDGHKARG